MDEYKNEASHFIPDNNCNTITIIAFTFLNCPRLVVNATRLEKRFS